MKEIHIVGIGMGSKDGISLEGLKAIERSKCLIGAKRMLEAYDYMNVEKFCSYRNDDIVKYIEETNYDNYSILVSGDIGFYSATKKLKDMLKDYNVNLICGISSVVYFASKVETSWDDMCILSLHARNDKFLGKVMTNKKTFLLTGGEKKANDICKILCENNFEALKVAVGENLSYENERIVFGTAKELSNESFENLSVMIIFNDDPLTDIYTTHGIEDEEFIRDRVPMTKSEIRNVALSKMKLKSDSISWDVGAGTGSVSIEMALKSLDGFVYAIEKKPMAVDLIKQNRRKFKANNLRIIQGTAPEALRALPAPDRVFIGGTSGNMDEIISIILEKNPDARFVITAITLETMAEAINALKKFKIKETDIVHMAVGKAKKVADYNMMMGLNPVYIITGQGVEEDEV